MVSEELCLTLLTRMLTLLPLALHFIDTMSPRPGSSLDKLLLLQCTFASLWEGINFNYMVASNWQYASTKTFSKLWVRLLKANCFDCKSPLPQTPVSCPEDCCHCLFFRDKLTGTLSSINQQEKRSVLLQDSQNMAVQQEHLIRILNSEACFSYRSKLDSTMNIE